MDVSLLLMAATVAFLLVDLVIALLMLYWLIAWRRRWR